MALARVFLALWLIVFVAGPAVAQSKAKPGPPKITPKATESRLSKEGLDFFEKRIRPILVKNCYKCHSGDPKKAKGSFVLDTHAGLMKGGDSGAVIEPGHPEKSLLIEAVKYEGLEMPPDGQLPDEVVEDFEKCVQLGAPDPRVGKAHDIRVVRTNSLLVPSKHRTTFEGTRRLRVFSKASGRSSRRWSVTKAAYSAELIRSRFDDTEFVVLLHGRHVPQHRGIATIV